MDARTANRWALGLCVVLLAAFLAQGWGFLRANSQTHDEAVHLSAGYSYLATHDFHDNPEHPPLLKELAALPLYLSDRSLFRPPPHLWAQKPEAEKWGIARHFFDHSGRSYDELLTLGRLPGLAMGGMLVALVGWWSYRLWGARAAVLGMGLAAFEPNLIANACLITTDVGSALFIFLTMYLLWEYGNSRSLLFLVGGAVTTGLALASKLTGVLLFGMGGVILAAHVLLPNSPLFPGRVAGGGWRVTGKEASSFPVTHHPPPATRLVRLKQAALIALVVGVLAALTILPPYFFQGWQGWTYGFHWQTTKGRFGHPAYFLGQYSDGGWYAYFPVAFLIKTPAATVALILASLVLFRAGSPLRRREALFLLLPVVVFLVLMIPAKINIGVRYLLPIYPFLFVCAARLGTLSFPRRWLAPALLGVPVLLTAVSSLRAAPHQLAYFSEIIGGPDQGHRYLADTNIDWGQELKGLKAYMEREGLPMVVLSYCGTAPPEAYGIRYQEAPSFGAVVWPPQAPEVIPENVPQVLAVSVTNLQGAYLGESGPYQAFYGRKPKAKIGYSIWIYDLTGDADAHRDLADVYLDAARREEAKADRFLEDGQPELAGQRRQAARQWRDLAAGEAEWVAAIRAGQAGVARR